MNWLFSWSHLDLCACLWSAVIVLGKPQLDNSALSCVLALMPFSDKGGAASRECKLLSMCLPVNWCSSLLSILLSKQSQNLAQFSSHVMLMISTLTLILTPPLSGHDHFCFWLYTGSLHMPKSNPNVVPPVLLYHFPSLAPPTFPPPVPIHVYPTCPGVRNRREGSGLFFILILFCVGL